MAYPTERSRTSFKNLTVLFTILCVALTPLTATADRCVEARAVSVPCEGVLLPPEAAQSGLQCLQVDLPRLKIEKAHEDALCKLRENRAQSVLELERKRTQEYRDLLTEAIKVKGPVPDPWYKHPALWVTIGVVVGAGATIGITYAVNQ